MKGFDTLNIKPAVDGHRPQDLSFDHLTTMNFGEVVPLLAKEILPGDKFNVQANYFSRMAAMPCPTYGKFSFRTMAVFVPFYQVAEDAEALVAGKTYWEGSQPYLRYVQIRDYCKYLLSAEISSSVSQPANTTDNGNGRFLDSNGDIKGSYDITYKNTNGTQAYRAWTPKGKLVVKIFTALGYPVPSKINLDTSSTWYQGYGAKLKSALPLLCFAKAYNDWMSQSQRFNTSPLSAFLKNVKNNSTQPGYSTSTRIISYSATPTSNGFKIIFDNILVCFENDYFTSAWQDPGVPASSGQNVSGITVPGANNSMGNSFNQQIKDSLSGAYAEDGSNPNYYFTDIYQRTIDFLRGYADWVRRNNYAGSRPVQNLYARFGVKTEDYRSNYAHVIGTDIMPINVGDVTATAQTYGPTKDKDVLVGDYAGKGIMSGNGSFEFKSSDYGYLFVLGWFTVTPMNCFGYDRSIDHLTTFDFYTPEFDGQDAQAISVGELYSDPLDPFTDSVEDDDIYGFTERYNEYRFSRDVVSGEFRDYHRDGDMLCWHTGRLLGDVRQAGHLVAQSSEMSTHPQTDSEFNRLFAITDSKEDKFRLTAQFKIDAVRPMKSHNEVVRLGVGDTVVPRNGNEIV